MSKESFLIYKSFYEPIKELSLEDKGRLLDAIFQFQIEGIEPIITNKIYMPFMFFKNQFRLDNLKYDSIVKRNKTNGMQGGRPEKPKEPSGFKKTQVNPENPSEPKKPDNDNDNDNDNEKENEKDSNFDIFWNQYNLISKKAKTDYQATLKYWDKLTINEKNKALENIKPYCDSISDKKFIKKARTYLSDKNFNDEHSKEIIFSGNFDDYVIPRGMFHNESDEHIISLIKRGNYIKK